MAVDVPAHPVEGRLQGVVLGPWQAREDPSLSQVRFGVSPM